MKKFIKKAFKCAAEFNSSACISRTNKVQKNHLEYMFDVTDEEIDELGHSINLEDKLDACLDLFYFCLTIADALKLDKKIHKYIAHSLSYEKDKWCKLNDDKVRLYQLVCRVSTDQIQKGYPLDVQMIKYLSFYLIASNIMGSWFGSFRKAFKAVHKANMNKFVGSKNLAWEGGNDYLQKHKINAFSVIENIDGLYFARTKVSGWSRVLKPSGWVAPDLTYYTTY